VADKGAVENKDGVSQDLANYAKKKPSAADYILHAARKSGRSPFQLFREFLRLRRKSGRLTISEDVQYGVYDLTRYSPEDQERFMSISVHWPLTRVCCDMTWQATTEDKWLCSHILASSDVAIPETVAVIDKTQRSYPGTRKIGSIDELRSFFTSAGALPLFGKENRGMVSAGVFLAESADAEQIYFKGADPMRYETFWEEFVGKNPYLLQRIVKNHSFFDPFSPTLATVRLVVLVTPEGVKTPTAVLKLPSSTNIADSFWRPGNLACNLDVKTGQILMARTKSPLETTDHEVHPETGTPLIGKTLPHWDGLLEMARGCAEIFAPVRYQSMDIAITESGPVLIEINTGGGFDLPQLASGKGFLTEEVKAFLRECGWKDV
jgi:hypothetical protein